MPPAQCSVPPATILASALLLVVGMTALPTRAVAQVIADREAGIQVAGYAGYAVFTDYFDAPAGVTFTNENAPIVGATISYAFSPRIAAVGHFGYARSTWRLENVPLLGDLNLGDAGIWMFDAGVRFQRPLTTATGPRLTPFVQLGAGAIRYTLGNAPLASLIGADAATTLAGNVGAGVDVAFAPRVGLQLMARDHIASFPSLEAGGFRAEGRVAHSLTFAAGLTYRF